MVTQILFFELCFKGLAGLLLILAPITVARVVGLPHGDVRLWPRVLGAALLGVAAAIWVENDIQNVRGLGLGGLIALNVVGLVLLVTITVGRVSTTRRGSLALWLTILILFALTVLEIIHLENV